MSDEIEEAVHQSSLKRKRSNESIDSDEEYFSAYSDIQIHQAMIEDEARTLTYRLAILRSYPQIQGKIVADVGAGTGILSMFCVHAGAKKVYAIEASNMADQAELVIKSNSMHDRITVIHGRVEDITLPEKVDVIVSEWMGYMMLFESMLPSVLFARDKWLKPGGLMLPKTAVLYLAPFSDSEYYDEQISSWNNAGDTFKVDLSALRPYAQHCLSRCMRIYSLAGENIMAREKEICRLDLDTIDPVELKKITSKFIFDCYGDEVVHGFVGWFKVFFPNDVCLSTAPHDKVTHWEQTAIFLKEPFAVRQGDNISGSITLTPNPRHQRYLDANVAYSHNDGPVTSINSELSSHS